MLARVSVAAGRSRERRAHAVGTPCYRVIRVGRAWRRRADDDEVATGPSAAARTAHAITLRVDYKRLNTFFADYTKNISKGGTFIRTTQAARRRAPSSSSSSSLPERSTRRSSQLTRRGHVDRRRRTRPTEEQPAGHGHPVPVFTDDAERDAARATSSTKLMSETLGEPRRGEAARQARSARPSTRPSALRSRGRCPSPARSPPSIRRSTSRTRSRA